MVATRKNPFSIGRVRFEKLLELIRLYQRQAEMCAQRRAYYGACILIGSALEGALLAMCHLYPEQARKALSELPTKSRPRGNIEDWSLNQLMRVADKARWLPARSNRYSRRMIGDWMLLVKELRNLVHPGKHIHDYPRVRLRKGHYTDVRAIFDAANDILLAKLESDVRRAIEKTKKKRKQ